MNFIVIRCAILFFVHIIGIQSVFAEELMKSGVEIIAVPKSGKGPMRVYMEPEVNNIKGPLKYRWYFGDGNESVEVIPKPHYYEFGRYNLVLEVTAEDGKLYTAGITIDAALPG